MGDTAWGLFSVGIISLATLGCGYPLVRGWLRDEPEDAFATLAWSGGAGLVGWGLALTALGLCGTFNPAAIVGLTLAAALAGIVPCWQLALLVRQAWENPLATPGERFELRVIVTVGGLILAASTIVALAPPTAGDALCYHLELPRRYLIEEGLVPLADHENGDFPLLAEMWFAGGLAFQAPSAAPLIHVGCGALLAAGTFLLGSPLVGRRASRWGALFVLLVPGVNNELTAPLNDVAVAALTTLGWAAALRARARPGAWGWCALSGWLLGGALGVKHLALLFGAALGVAWLVSLWREASTRRLRILQGGAIVVVALSVGGVWYARSAWHTGDPLYPFLTRRDDATLGLDSARKRPLSFTPGDMIQAPWRVTFEPERFGGRAFQLGPWFLMACPAMIVALRRYPPLAPWGIVAGVYVLGWYTLRQNVRFLLPALPLLSVAGAAGWLALERGSPGARRLAAGGVAAMLVVLTAIPIARSRDVWRVVVGLESRETYLARVEPSYTPGAWMSRAGGEDWHTLSDEQRAFYLPGRVTRASLNRRRTGWDNRAIPPRERLDALREAGFSHLLVAAAEGGETVPYDPALAELVAAGWSDEERERRQLGKWTHVDRWGGQRRYWLFMLPELPPVVGSKLVEHVHAKR